MSRSRFVAAGFCLSTTLGALVGGPAPVGAQEQDVLEPGPEVNVTIEVSPTSGPLDGRFAVSGTGCIPQDVEAAVTIAIALHEDLGFTLVTRPNGDGTWSTDFVLPTGFPPGEYFISAHCWPHKVYEGTGALSELLTFTATPAPAPPPARPVTRQPRVTG